MDKIDYKKQHKELYAGRVGVPSIVQVPALNFLKVDGVGDPNSSQEYVEAIQALYPVAYTLKFMCKKTLGLDYGVMPLEGLWWTPDMRDFSMDDKSKWHWTMMIMQPSMVTDDLFAEAIAAVRGKRNPVALDKVRLESYTEGRAAQVLYMGPYADEGPTIAALHEFIRANGGALEATAKHHHEIYLNDPSRVAPEKIKTIIRQPF